MANTTRHKANYLASHFFMSKFSLKRKLTMRSIVITRYICDIIDMTKNTQVALSHRQIALYCYSHKETVAIILKKLAKLRIIKIHPSTKPKSKSSYSVGALLIAYANRSERIKAQNRIVDKFKSGRIQKKSGRIGESDSKNLGGLDAHAYNKASNNISNTEELFLTDEQKALKQKIGDEITALKNKLKVHIR